jgi:MFS superfamily sulfate permease-like transporter
MSVPARPVSAVQRLLPILGWLPSYRRDWLLPDVLAGLAIWAVMVPEGMAYAGIVGVPAIMGLYTIVPPLVAYAIFGTSRLLVVGPDTATGLISALTVGTIAAQGGADFNALSSTLAILIGAIFLLLGAYYLLRETPAGMDPYDPAAPLMFMSSAMNGTSISGANRYSANRSASAT